MKTAILWIASLVLAAFFAFVGWYKTFAPLTELAKHGAYTIHIPEWMGRIAGVTEMLCALALLAGLNPGWRADTKWGAIYLVASQIVSGVIHVQHAEFDALWGNARWMALAFLLLALCARNETTTPLAGDRN